MKITSEVHSFGGRQVSYEHDSSSTKTSMRFSVFLPPQSGPRPVLWYLSGLTCNDQNVVTKGGYQRVAAELGLIVVAPDTSPRGLSIEGEDLDWDFGSGAGFYLNATKNPWSNNYNMYSYIVEELQEDLLPLLPGDASKQGIFGHSMGGLGALVLGLRNPILYKSISAFSPICAPSQVPWGKKAFSGYLKTEQEWAQYDPTLLIQSGKKSAPILIDQGTSDNFLKEQLCPEVFKSACEEMDQAVEVRFQEEYDHSYYFISTFMEDHLRHHSRLLTPDM